MSRAQEVVLGLALVIGAPIAFPWIMDNIWDEWLSAEVVKAMPDGAWGDAFMAGFPIGILVVIIGFGILLLIGKMSAKDKRER